MANLTKKAIAVSVTRLLEKKPLDKITIREITDDCGMTRNTFYYHFQDIYDLCSWIFAAQAEELIGRYKKDDSGLGDMFVEGLEYLYENKRMIRHVYDSVPVSCSGDLEVCDGDHRTVRRRYAGERRSGEAHSGVLPACIRCQSAAVDQ